MKAPSRLLAAIVVVVSGIGTAYADQILDGAAHSRAARSIASSPSAAHSVTAVADVSLQPHGRLRPEPEADRHGHPMTDSPDAARATPVAASNGIISLAAADDTGAIAPAQRPARSQSAVPALAKSPGTPQETPVAASWITLLCGLVVMAFMASRRGSDPD